MTPPAVHLRWPPERLYWAIVEAPGFAQRGGLPVGLREPVEEQLPVPLDALQVVCAPANGGMVLVCAAVSAELASVPPGTLSLTPESLPPFAPAGVDAEDLNLLVGALEPRPLQRARVRRHTVGAAAVLLCALVLGLGLARRTRHWLAAADQAESAAVSALASAGLRADGLAAELSRVRRVAGTAGELRPPPDAALTLASFLAAWPARAVALPQSISVAPAGISVAVTLEGDPSEFLRAFSPPAGWMLDEPRLNAAGPLTRLNLHLRRGNGS